MATFSPKGQYKTTKITDFYLDVWNPSTIKEDPLDEYMQLSARYDRRPDLLSYDKYGTASYWWVFMMRNKDIIFDPISDFKAGTWIYIPSIEGN